MIWCDRLPWSVFADEGVGEQEELAGDGDEGDLCDLSGAQETLIERLHIGIGAAGGQRCEIEGASDPGPAALDVSLALAVTGVVGDGGEAGEQGDLFGGQAAKLGKPGQQGCGDHRSDAGDGEQDHIASGQRLVGLDASSDLTLERLNIRTKTPAAPVELPAQKGGGGRTSLVLEGGPFGDRAFPGLDEFLERFERLGRRLSGGGRQAGGKERQQARVQPIRLRQQAHGVGEQAGAQRVDHRHPIAAGMEAAVDLAVLFACGLDDDPLYPINLEPAFELPMALGRVGNAKSLARGQEMDIEPGFANVDPHARALSDHMGSI